MTDEMILFCLLGLMLAAAVILILPALLRVGSDDTQSAGPTQTEVVAEALRARAAELREDLAKGEISQAEFDDAMAELERRAVEEHQSAQSGEKKTVLAGGRRTGVLFAALTVLAMAGLSGGLYVFQGAPEMLTLIKQQAVIGGKGDIDSLQVYLRDNGRDGRAWILLAHKYAEADRFADAVNAYREARRVSTKIRKDPDIMLEMGAALLTVGTPEASKEAQPLLTDALEADPENFKTVELLAMAAVANGDWQTAAAQVRTILGAMKPDTAEYMRYSRTLQMLEQRAAGK